MLDELSQFLFNQNSIAGWEYQNWMLVISLEIRRSAGRVKRKTRMKAPALTFQTQHHFGSRTLSSLSRAMRSYGSVGCLMRYRSPPPGPGNRFVTT
jgi:hypothetical protein